MSEQQNASLKQLSIIKDDFRVIVTPRIGPFLLRISKAEIRETEERACRAMLGQIQRHVDNVKLATIEYDLLCPFCESIYEPKPGCCNAAVDADEKGTWPKHAK